MLEIRVFGKGYMDFYFQLGCKYINELHSYGSSKTKILLY